MVVSWDLTMIEATNMAISLDLSNNNGELNLQEWWYNGIWCIYMYIYKIMYIYIYVYLICCWYIKILLNHNIFWCGEWWLSWLSMKFEFRCSLTILTRGSTQAFFTKTWWVAVREEWCIMEPSRERHNKTYNIWYIYIWYRYIGWFTGLGIESLLLNHLILTSLYKSLVT